MPRRATRLALLAASLPILPINAQSVPTVATTVDVAQTTLGISIGRMSGAPLWSVDRQPLLSSFDAPAIVATALTWWHFRDQ